MGSLYTKLKIFHFPEKLRSLDKDSKEILAPIHIRMKPTNVCNHQCTYCAYRADNLQLGKDMVLKDSIPRAKMQEIVKDIISMGVKAVTFSGGGEPFCYPYLEETARALVDGGVKIAALSNGALVKGSAARIFAEKASWLRISMDGWDDASYSTYRGVKEGEFSKIINNIREFKKFKGKCLLGISIILDKDNYSHVYDLMGELKSVGADSVKISPCIVSNTSEENNDYHDRFFQEAVRIIKKTEDAYADGSFQVYNAYHRQEINFSKDYNWCPYLQILPIIGADLNVYSCQDKAYNLDCGLVGSIQNKSFKDFWFSEKNKFFKIDPSKHCDHHCVADGKNRMVLDYMDADKEHLGFV